MDWKYSVITGFMGGYKDRFINYADPRNIEQIFEMASRIKGCSGLEMVYPQNFSDPVKVKGLLKQYNLGVSTLNLNLKGDEIWRFGSFSSPDPKVRKEAVKWMKTAMDFCAELDCDTVTCCILADGSDYPFELDYVRAFNDTIEGVRECADYRKDIRISMEYKVSEPRAHCLLSDAGKTAYFCKLVGRDNVGVTLDFGHAAQAGEIPADSAAFLGSTGLLYYVHINDNYRNWDWDMVPGTVNFWDYLEFIIYLKKVNYTGWITADVFPYRHDPIRIMEKTFEWMDYLIAVTNQIDDKTLFEMMKTKDAFDILDYVRSCVKKV